MLPYVTHLIIMIAFPSPEIIHIRLDYILSHIYVQNNFQLTLN